MQDALLKARREQLRWRILAILDTSRPVRMGEVLLLSMLHSTGLDTTANELRRELDYLCDRKLVATTGRHELICRLTYMGTDVVEYTIPCNPGIARPAHAPDPRAKAQRELLRWRILAVLQNGRPVKMQEDFLLSIICDSALQVTLSEQRRELDYLEDRNLVTVERDAGPWLCDITHYGTDVVEETVECYPGIARPRQ